MHVMVLGSSSGGAFEAEGSATGSHNNLRWQTRTVWIWVRALRLREVPDG